MKGSGLKCRQLGQVRKKAAVTDILGSEFLLLVFEFFENG